MNKIDWAAAATTVELIAPARKTSTATGTGVDLSLYAGKCLVVLTSSAGGGTTPTLDVKLQTSATVGGTYADISGATFTQVTDAADATEAIVVNLDGIATPFVRAVGTITGTSPTFDIGVTLIGMKQVLA